MKRTALLLAVILTALLFFGCGVGDKSGKNLNAGNVEGCWVLKDQKSNVMQFDANGTLIEARVSGGAVRNMSLCKWTASSDYGVLTIDDDSSEKARMYYYKVDKNELMLQEENSNRTVVYVKYNGTVFNYFEEQGVDMYEKSPTWSDAVTDAVTTNANTDTSKTEGN